MAKKEFSFNEAVKEIEKILLEIESGEMDVDRLSVEVKRASELIRQCQKKAKVDRGRDQYNLQRAYIKNPAAHSTAGIYFTTLNLNLLKKTHRNLSWLLPLLCITY